MPFRSAAVLPRGASKTKVKVLREADPNAEAQPIRSNDPVYPGDVIMVPERFF